MHKTLTQTVEAIVAEIPRGRVMTYGQLAALAGSPRAARIVGGIAHFGAIYRHASPECPFLQLTSLDDSLECDGCGGPLMPWHRVVNRKGGLASGYHGGRRAQKERLQAEGVQVHGEADVYWVDVEHLIWWPDKERS